jgi:hypothetical protein
MVLQCSFGITLWVNDDAREALTRASRLRGNSRISTISNARRIIFRCSRSAHRHSMTPSPWLVNFEQVAAW